MAEGEQFREEYIGPLVRHNYAFRNGCAHSYRKAQRCSAVYLLSQWPASLTRIKLIGYPFPCFPKVRISHAT